MANAQKPEVAKEELEKAHSLWLGFTSWMKWGIISTVIILALMALTLV